MNQQSHSIQRIRATHVAMGTLQCPRISIMRGKHGRFMSVRKPHLAFKFGKSLKEMAGTCDVDPGFLKLWAVYGN